MAKAQQLDFAGHRSIHIQRDGEDIVANPQKMSPAQRVEFIGKTLTAKQRKHLLEAGVLILVQPVPEHEGVTVSKAKGSVDPPAEPEPPADEPPADDGGDPPAEE